MATQTYTILENRGIIAISGEDARDFLQGIISIDTQTISNTTTRYGAFLTPQGKFLFDFFITEHNGVLLLDTERARIGDFIKRLSMYKLRAKIDLSDISNDYCVVAVYGDGIASALGLTENLGETAPFESGLAYVDPRVIEAGVRVIAPKSEVIAALGTKTISPSAMDDYQQHRLTLGLPESGTDLIVDKSILLESGLDDLHAIDWDKGCYMGQEVTARTKHRGLVKKRLVPVSIEGDIPENGTSIISDDRAAGEMRSANGNIGLALMKVDYLSADNGNVFKADNSSLTVRKPSWATY